MTSGHLEARGPSESSLPNAILEEVIEIALTAGEVVLEVYRSGCAVERKADGSPVTEADHRAEEIICPRLSQVAPGVPIVAEERRACDHPPAPPESFWLVDPLDGTKEFVSGNGEFTVNIALIESGVPVLGVILAPALGQLYAAAKDTAFADDGNGRRSLAARTEPVEGATIVSSRSHGDPEALAKLIEGRRISRSLTAGSSLKFCLVAAGEADLYPRFGRTMEWDTAAGDAIVRAAGGQVTDLEGRPLTYGKPGYENPAFIARGLGAQ